jgi:hypothetical protein
MKFQISLIAVLIVLSCFFSITSAEWRISTVDPEGNLGRYNSLALDGAGHPHISYLSSDGLKYAEWTGSAWETGIVDLDASTGKYSSLALDEAGDPHISYYDEDTHDLKYAQRLSSGVWQTETVDTEGDVGMYTSLVEVSDTHRITYYNATSGDLKMALWIEGWGWIIENVDTTGDVGKYGSQARYSNPRISYYDDTTDDLKYARYTETGWITSTVDSDGIVGRYCSLAIDGSGNPHISYIDTTNHALKRAQWYPALGWLKETVNPGPHVYEYTSLALDGDGSPHISYYDASLGDLKYAKLTLSGWQLRTVDTQLIVGQYPSLSLDSDGNPHISYYDVANYRLKYAEFVPAKTGIGVFRPSTHMFYLDYNGNGAWNGAITDRQYNFGLTGDSPVSGKWSGTGASCIGVFRPSTHMFYLDYDGNGAWNGAIPDRQYNFGLAGDLPVTGDWNADGSTEIGVFRPSTHTFYLDHTGNGAWDGVLGNADLQYNFGLTGDLPVAGDWNADGFCDIGVFRPSTHTFYLDYNGNGAWNGVAVDRAFNFGLTGDVPVSGDWGGIGTTFIGVFRPSTHTFYLDYNGNGAWNGAAADRTFNFGSTGDSPVSGNWV